VSANQIARNTKLGCLFALRMQGFLPSVVLDVGAQTGTNALYRAFPDATLIMIEPVEEHRTTLLKLASQLKHAEVVIAAAAAKTGETCLHLSENAQYTYTSDNEEVEDGFVNIRKIACVRVDDLCHERALKGSFLVKIDVDGTEMEVLQDMTGILNETECVIAETVFFGEDPNSFYEILHFMQYHDFIVYDLVEPLYRPGDLALWQMDAIFVKRQGRFRQFHEYADAAGMKHLRE
jgi:FkbM family methyltransferase